MTVPCAAEEPAGELLSCRFGQAPVCYTDVVTGLTTVSVYLPQRPAWTTSTAAELREALIGLAQNRLVHGPSPFVLGRVRQEDWAESWKRHFRPLEIGHALLLKPSWSVRQPRPGQAVLILDPGLSFGTGQHPTTRFCLQQIVRGRPRATRPSLLDVGTGSGILALAAARLHYAPVRAIDFDPVAIRVARQNARANRLARNIQLKHQDVARLALNPRVKYSLVCANLAADLLLKYREHLGAQVAPGGRLVVAGILRSEFAGVRRSYETAGWRLLSSGYGGEWRSGSFARRD